MSEPTYADKQLIVEAWNFGHFADNTTMPKALLAALTRIAEAWGETQPQCFYASGRFVRGPARPSGSGFKEVVFELPSEEKARMTAESLNELFYADQSKWPIKPLKEVQVTLHDGTSAMLRPERAYFDAWAMQELENSLKGQKS
jgi:hypothetical protein